MNDRIGSGANPRRGGAAETTSEDIGYDEPYQDLVTPGSILTDVLEKLPSLMQDDDFSEMQSEVWRLTDYVRSHDLSSEQVRESIVLAAFRTGESHDRARPIANWLVDQMLYASDIPPPMRRPSDQPPEPDRSGMVILSTADCGTEDTRPYVIKGFLSEGDVGCIFGQPCSGKSLIAPHIGYRVAQGMPVFGHRTSQRHVLYVAAEDYRGMQLRVKALSRRHGGTGLFNLTTVDNLMIEGSDLASGFKPDRDKLLEYVKTMRPGLVIIDTLAAAWPGLEENDASQMGKVVKYSRKLVQWGAAVLILHHPAKADGASTPRGSGVFNGDLDFSLQLYAADKDGLVRGYGRKNRNGSVESATLAFKIGIESFGADQDGDPLTAALVDKATDCAPLAVKLTRGEAAAVKCLTALAICVDDGKVAEAAWLGECDDKRVCASEDPKNRRDVLKRTYRSLLTKDVIDAAGGMVWLQQAGNEFLSQPAPLNTEAAADMAAL